MLAKQWSRGVKEWVPYVEVLHMLGVGAATLHTRKLLREEARVQLLTKHLLHEGPIIVGTRQQNHLPYPPMRKDISHHHH